MEDQLALPLLCRLDAPSVVPPQLIAQCKTYRDAVKLCWNLRRVKNMTRSRLAEEAGLYPSHVTWYLNDGKRQCDLPGSAVRAFQWACGNTAVSQFLAMQAQLTVVEEMQAQRIEMLASAHESDRTYTLRNFGDVMTVQQGPWDHYVAMLAAAPEAP